jgi:hypothetical protein
MPVTISLDAIGNPDEVRVSKNLGPTDQIESGLRSEIWELETGASSLVHEYPVRDDFYQSELKMEAASTGVTLHFPNQSPNAG